MPEKKQYRMLEIFDFVSNHEYSNELLKRRRLEAHRVMAEKLAENYSITIFGQFSRCTDNKITVDDPPSEMIWICGEQVSRSFNLVFEAIKEKQIPWRDKTTPNSFLNESVQYLPPEITALKVSTYAQV